MALTFFWRCEGTTLSTPNDDYSDGDTTAAAQSAGAIASGAAKIGTNGLDSPDGNDHFLFAVSSSDIVIESEGSMAFWMYPVSGWQASQVVMRARTAASPTNKIEIQKLGSAGSSTGEMRLRIQNPGNANTDIDTTSAGMSHGNWYFIVVRWHASNLDGRIEVYDSSLSELDAVEDLSVTAANFPAATFDEFRIGDQLGGSEDTWFDNIFISDTYGEDLEGNANITAASDFGGAGGATPKGVFGLALHGPFGGAI